MWESSVFKITREYRILYLFEAKEADSSSSVQGTSLSNRQTKVQAGPEGGQPVCKVWRKRADAAQDTDMDAGGEILCRPTTREL